MRPEPVDERLRHEFLRRFALVGTVVSGVECAVNWKIGTPLGLAGLVAMTLGFLLILSASRWRGTALALVLWSGLWITLFDTGFGGRDAIWAFHTPLLLVAWTLFPGRIARAAAAIFPLVSTALVSLGATPRLAAAFELSQLSVAFSYLLALLSCVSTLFLLLKAQEQTLSERDTALARAERASRAKSEFLSHMSHELRTPLHAISGFADFLLQEAPENGSAREHAQAIRESSEHLVHLINDILDLSRLENGNIALADTPFAPVRCLEEVERLLVPLATEKGLALEVSPEELPRIRGDRVRWKQVVLNLAGNAVKYTSSGSVRVATTWAPQGKTEGQLVVTVQDTGPGIPPDQAERIFEQFVRLDDRPSPGAPSGTGLGLVISRKLARAMGGDVRLDTTPEGGGARFVFAIPGRIESDDRTRSSASSWAAVRLAGTRVLLAEDNRLNVRLAVRILERLGAECDVAENGEIALTRLRERSYDLLLLDLHMPVLDGWQVMEELRRPDNGILRPDLPVIALTADAFEETRRRTHEAGMVDFLPKPFQAAELAERCSRHLPRPNP